MDQSLAYLHEVLSNYVSENSSIKDLDQWIGSYSSEEDFVNNLNQEQMHMLEQILTKEMHHANESGDHERGYQLHEVYELLY
ncbi:sporulation protein [Radiobacillus sp. PE A8.2]|uniref:sporulation protein n=1 Tax=Radiobacillus sp. PE A8.2 TaxID=3380349 RepID=UPI00388CF4AD